MPILNYQQNRALQDCQLSMPHRGLTPQLESWTTNSYDGILESSQMSIENSSEQNVNGLLNCTREHKVGWCWTREKKSWITVLTMDIYKFIMKKVFCTFISSLSPYPIYSRQTVLFDMINVSSLIISQQQCQAKSNAINLVSHFITMCKWSMLIHLI